MIARWLSAAAVVFFGAAAMAAGPASQPAGGVIVFPFGSLGDTGQYAWIGKAIQDNVLSDVGRLRGTQPFSGQRAPADLKEAASAARDAGAQFAVFGSFQLLGNDMRVTGQVVDVTTGQVVGAVKATGSLQDLFAIEDTVADQVRRTVQNRTGSTEAVASPPPTSLPPQQAAVPVPPRPYPWDVAPSYAADRSALMDRYRYDTTYNNYPYGVNPYYNGWWNTPMFVVVPGSGTTVPLFGSTPVLLGGNTPGPIQGGNFMGPIPGGNFMQPTNVRSPDVNRR